MFRFLLRGPLIIILSLSLETRAGANLPDIQVANEFGQSKSLSKILDQDSLLMLGYYNCRHLCHNTIHQLQKKLSRFKKYPQVVFLSLREDEGPGDALRFKKRLPKNISPHYQFLVSRKQEVVKLANFLNFSFKEDPATGSLTHENAVYFISQNQLARKFMGMKFKEQDLKLTSTPGKFFDYKEFCSEFDPSKSKYGLLVIKGLSVFSALFILIAGFFFIRSRKESA